MIPFVLRLLKIMAVAAPVYLLLRRPWRHPNRREAAMALFALFMVGLLTLALEGDYGTPRQMLETAKRRLATQHYMNLRPFYTIRSFFKYANTDDFLVNIVGNILMFAPWGFGITLLWKKNRTPWRIVMLSFLLTAFIETVQLFIGRHVDVDDLLLNFLGSCMGAALWWVLQKLFPFFRSFGK